jgi:hypothetical protein
MRLGGGDSDWLREPLGSVALDRDLSSLWLAVIGNDDRFLSFLVTVSQPLSFMSGGGGRGSIYRNVGAE